VGKKLSTVWGNFSQGAGTPGTQRGIVFSQLVVKVLTPTKLQHSAFIDLSINVPPSALQQPSKMGGRGSMNNV
jgi:hypothetical protein